MRSGLVTVTESWPEFASLCFKDRRWWWADVAAAGTRLVAFQSPSSIPPAPLNKGFCPFSLLLHHKSLSNLIEKEYVSSEGLRLDGRGPSEMRQLQAEIGVVAKVDGSAMFEMGNTKVTAAVYGPREVQNRSQQITDQAPVRCEYSMANFSIGDRMRKPKVDRRSTEVSLVISQTMEACILTNLMPRSQIDIFVQVLQADGGTRSACINAATLALADVGIPMRDIVTSCSAGYLNSIPLLDSAGGPDVTVGILPTLDKVTLLQMDAKLPTNTFEDVMQLATEGCKAVANSIREVLLENTKQLECRRGS
ncbi:exosome complex component RRP41 homolog [Pistacia vera]|uniref:exosome complex component RRP41 homolog n=1 Tax=Pistacia vera TaxID=55513 RepID=UPI001262CFA7|nr:exosome complex component RRP41 homolog [Pistacia vera]